MPNHYACSSGETCMTPKSVINTQKCIFWNDVSPVHKPLTHARAHNRSHRQGLIARSHSAHSVFPKYATNHKLPIHLAGYFVNVLYFPFIHANHWFATCDPRHPLRTAQVPASVPQAAGQLPGLSKMNKGVEPSQCPELWNKLDSSVEIVRLSETESPQNRNGSNCWADGCDTAERWRG